MEIPLDRPVAVIADVHGNSDALIAVLADIDAEGIETILNLGDHFSGPLAAAETAEILARREMTSIRGNHDRWLIEQAPEAMGPSDRAAYDQLDPGALDLLRAMPATRRLGDEIFMCHGTPGSDTDYWLERVAPDGAILLRDREGIEAAADRIPSPLILCGHTHTARAIRLADGRLIVNPGSVGLPAYDDDAPVPHVVEAGSPDARYAVMRRVDGLWRAELRALPYDASRMAKLAAEAGRPEWSAAVSTGRLA
ncbi:MAG: metallophosphoesterase family protein [Pseudomonadota bacterium]